MNSGYFKQVLTSQDSFAKILDKIHAFPGVIAFLQQDRHLTLRLEKNWGIYLIMPIISPHSDNPLVDGRQSDRALMVRRGVQRLFSDLRLSMVPELSLASGRRADLVALSGTGEIWIVEIKSSIEDLRCDAKWPEYRQHCDRLFFATHAGVPAGLFPQDCGLIVADTWSGHMMREAPEHRLAAATRKAMMLRFARAAADRLLLAELAAG